MKNANIYHPRIYRKKSLVNYQCLPTSFFLHLNKQLDFSFPFMQFFLSFIFYFLFFWCDSSISILMSKSLSVFTGRKEEKTWFATRRSFNYKTICTGRRREKGMSLFVYVICILNAILTLLTPVLMNFSGIVVSKLQMSLPVRPATKAEQMRECLRSLKQNHKVNNSKLLYQ